MLRTRTLLALFALTAGCADDDGSKHSPLGQGDGDCEHPIESCEPLAAACDIRKAACQKEVFRATACERAQRCAEAPPVRLITRAQLRSELEASVGDSKPSTQEQAWERASKLLGFLPTDQTSDGTSVDLFVDGVAAYYSSDTKDITVIEDAAGNDDEGTFTLSHEYVHALQDQRDPFEDVYAANYDSTDSMIALDSLFEGEATVLSNFVMLRMDGTPAQNVDFGQYFSDMLDTMLDEIASSGAPLMSATDVLPYPIGGQGLADLYMESGLDSIEALYDSPFVTVSGWRVPNVDFPEELDCELPGAPADHKLVLSDRLGSAGLLAMDVVLGNGTGAFVNKPGRWRSDGVSVFVSGSKTPANVALAWRVRLATSNQAANLAQDLEQLASDRLSVDQKGNEVLIAASEDPAVLAGWKALGQCVAPGEPKTIQPQQRLAASLVKRRLGLMF